MGATRSRPFPPPGYVVTFTRAGFQRLQGTRAGGRFVDVNTIRAIAIGRLEVANEGAAGDAVGGHQRRRTDGHDDLGRELLVLAAERCGRPARTTAR